MIPLRPSHVVFYAAVVTLTVTLAVGFGFWFIRQQMLTGNDFLLDAESKEILARARANSRRRLMPGTSRRPCANTRKMTRRCFTSRCMNRPARCSTTRPTWAAESLTDLTGGLDKRTLELPPFGLLRVAEYHTPTVHVQIAMSLRNFQSINDSFVRVFLLGVPLIAVLSIGFGMALRNSTLRPVRLMQAAARHISASNLSERIVVPPGSGEMAALARLLNEMIDRLEKSFNHAKRFTADVSHELMTPLSIIRLHTERLLNDPELPAKYRHSVEEQLQETLHLAETLERLLMLAKADSSALSLNRQVHFDERVYRPVCRGRPIAGGEPGTKSESWPRTKRAWQRLTRAGCVRCCSTCSRMRCVSARRMEPSASNPDVPMDSGPWKLTDEGEGVPPDRLNDIFERFVQITSRAEPGSGAGLGLAICKSIVELHHGFMCAHNRTDRSGLTVTFAIPIQGQSA